MGRLRDTLRKLLSGSGASKESESERDGAFSYSAEWHAFAHGLYAGMRRWKGTPGELPDNEDVQKEPHYYKGAYVLGTLLQLVVVAVGGALGAVAF